MTDIAPAPKAILLIVLVTLSLTSADLLYAAILGGTSENVALYTIFFVIPVGGLVIWYCGALCIPIWAAINNIKPACLSIIIGAITGLISLMGSFWFAYEIVYPGEPGIWNFIRWMTDGNIVIHFEYGHAEADADAGSVNVLGWISLAVQPVGAILGGNGAAVTSPQELFSWASQNKDAEPPNS